MPDTHTCIVYLHIPKTGGSTLRATLRYKHPSQTLSLYSTSRPLEAIEQVPLDERRAARIVSGHLHYGVHRFIPQECRYITLLRDPVARAHSQYRHVLTHPEHRFHAEVVESGMGLEGFVERGIEMVSGPVDNGQTRFVSGRRSGKLDEEDLATAKSNLDRFLVAGLTERFDESFILIRRALGWKLPVYATRNVTKVSAAAVPPSPEAIELIHQRDRLDLELYGYAEQLFQAAVDRAGRGFRHEVAAFRILNWIPGTLGPYIPSSWRNSLRSRIASSPRPAIDRPSSTR